jgi:hypothetical protein
MMRSCSCDSTLACEASMDSGGGGDADDLICVCVLQGVFPTATMRWNKQQWNQFGYYSWQGATPGLDWQLFQVESFLDEQDMAALHALGHLA